MIVEETLGENTDMGSGYFIQPLVTLQEAGSAERLRCQSSAPAKDAVYCY